MKSKVLLVVLTVMIAISLTVPAAYAMGKSCSMCAKKKMMYKKGLEGKFYSKVKFMLRHPFYRGIVQILHPFIHGP